MAEATEIFVILQNSKHKQEFDDLISRAIKYARIRTDWYMAALKGLAVDENERTSAHDDFIACCAEISAKMKQSGEPAEWRIKIGRDRKAIDDFTCLLHAVLGIMEQMQNKPRLSRFKSIAGTIEANALPQWVSVAKERICGNFNTRNDGL